MFNYLILFNLFFNIYAKLDFAYWKEAPKALFGPTHPPMKGSVWPLPQSQKLEDTYYSFLPKAFKIKILGQNCTLIHRAVKRFIGVCKLMHKTTAKLRKFLKNCTKASYQEDDDRFRGRIEELWITAREACESIPHLEMDESYELEVSHITKLYGESVWGVMRGLDTLAQLFYMDDYSGEFIINATTIFDFPYYKHRGLLLDTSRHYISVENILTTLEAMAINKMNVFHWHIVDDQSFPYVSEKLPELSAKGAFHPSLVYTPENIAQVINYATERGIRVVPEFDIPGHSQSWGRAFPTLLTKCTPTPGSLSEKGSRYQKGELQNRLGPMNPVNNRTYQMLQALFEEVRKVFPDQYVHLGGDEVDVECWATNPEILAYMEKEGYTNIVEMHSTFLHRTLSYMGKAKIIVWQDVFQEQVKLPPDALVQIWKSKDVIHVMRDILAAKHKVIYSAPWYIDSKSSSLKVELLYNTDPRHHFEAPAATGIIGGEACVWSDLIDDTNLISCAWPGASVIAEVLWRSPEPSARPPHSLFNRLEEHVCRMRHRGVKAAPPTGPGFCLL